MVKAPAASVMALLITLSSLSLRTSTVAPSTAVLPLNPRDFTVPATVSGSGTVTTSASRPEQPRFAGCASAGGVASGVGGAASMVPASTVRASATAASGGVLASSPQA